MEGCGWRTPSRTVVWKDHHCCAMPSEWTSDGPQLHPGECKSVSTSLPPVPIAQRQREEMRRKKGGEICPLRGTVSLGYGELLISPQDMGYIPGASFDARRGGTVDGGDRSIVGLASRENVGMRPRRTPSTSVAHVVQNHAHERQRKKDTRTKRKAIEDGRIQAHRGCFVVSNHGRQVCSIQNKESTPWKRFSQERQCGR